MKKCYILKSAKLRLLDPNPSLKNSIEPKSGNLKKEIIVNFCMNQNMSNYSLLCIYMEK